MSGTFQLESFDGAPNIKFIIHQAERLWSDSEEGERISKELVSTRWRQIIQMEREMEISHEEEYGIDIPGQADLENIVV